MDDSTIQELIDQRNQYFNELLQQSFQIDGFEGSLVAFVLGEQYVVSNVKMFYFEGKQVFYSENEETIRDGDIFCATHVIHLNENHMVVDYRKKIGDTEHPNGQWKMAYETDEEFKDF